MARTEPQKVEWPGSASLSGGSPEGWLTRSKAAQLCGRSPDTLKRWRKDGTFTPSGYAVHGKLTIYLYSEDDIEALIEIAGTKRAGRPPKTEGEDEGSNHSGNV